MRFIFLQIKYRMTSVLTRFAQIPAFSYWIVENNGGYMLNTLTMDDTYSLDANTVLADMGKTVVIDGYIYRKVQVATASYVISSGNQTGYICLNSDRAPLFSGNNQGVSKMN
jgi:hypothetical protein